jgi:hypothetical protein
MTRRPLRGAAIKPPSLSPWATGCTRKAGDPGEACLPTGHRAVRKVSADPAKATGADAAISACTLKTRAAELS